MIRVGGSYGGRVMTTRVGLATISVSMLTVSKHLTIYDTC